MRFARHSSGDRQTEPMGDAHRHQRCFPARQSASVEDGERRRESGTADNGDMSDNRVTRSASGTLSHQPNV
jgi:hypothetical protein